MDIADAVVEPLMQIFHGDGRLLDIGGLHCRRICEPEHKFLKCIALLQHHQVEEAEQLLHSFMRKAAAGTAMTLAWRLANRLMLAGMCLPLRREQPTCPGCSNGETVH